MAARAVESEWLESGEYPGQRVRVVLADGEWRAEVEVRVGSDILAEVGLRGGVVEWATKKALDKALMYEGDRLPRLDGETLEFRRDTPGLFL